MTVLSITTLVRVHCSICGADQQADWSAVRTTYTMSLLKLYKAEGSKGLLGKELLEL